MAKPTGFLDVRRQKQPYRPVAKRLLDWNQVLSDYTPEELNLQAARCMDCGIPFCHEACPLGNLIPDWNDLVYREQWSESNDRLHATNNFPEFTGTLCPAPCEGSCVLGLTEESVTIKAVELAIIDRAFDESWIVPQPPTSESGKLVAVVGSGPAGLAGAQQLRRAGHRVTVYERDDRIGGLLRYGIPEFKMEKWILDRRLQQLRDEGITFEANINIGVDVTLDELRREFDAILLAGGATTPRDLPVPGRKLDGVYFAMDFLSMQNRLCEGDVVPDKESMTAKNKHVVIIGGGDTGADCLGTVHRQGALSVHNLEVMPKPPDRRGTDNPWPEWPDIYRVSAAHEEGGDRIYSVSTKQFVGNDQGEVKELELVEVATQILNSKQSYTELPNSTHKLPCDLALLAMGFLGPEQSGLIQQSGLELDHRSNVKRDDRWKTSVEQVFVAGDMQRGQSLIVWAIADGRAAAQSIDEFLAATPQLRVSNR